jgi:hypothetical protein
VRGTTRRVCNRACARACSASACALRGRRVVLVRFACGGLGVGVLFSSVPSQPPSANSLRSTGTNKTHKAALTERSLASQRVLRCAALRSACNERAAKQTNKQTNQQTNKQATDRPTTFAKAARPRCAVAFDSVRVLRCDPFADPRRRTSRACRRTRRSCARRSSKRSAPTSAPAATAGY